MSYSQPGQRAFARGSARSRTVFPSLGKIRAKSSKAWKSGREIFQSLMDTTKVAGRGYAATEPHAEREDYFAPP